jgi:cation diffusion facilitator CzcD-associated flavoprotein CzcO
MATRELDAVVVGAGLAGMYMLHRLRGMGLAVRVLEAGGGVGGTWYWNRYPGARCDVESMEYSYQFSDELQQEWEWSERYAAQPEILRYANHVADRFDLRKDIQFDTRVTAAVFDEAAGRWRIRTADGAELSATFCIMATGCLSAPNRPRLVGRERFRGRIYHTGEWPHEGVDFSGLRVGVIGTGSSAIQAIPRIAQQARQLVVFQRTPNYAVPAQNAPLDAEVQREVKANYTALRARAKQGRTGLLYPINPLPAGAASAAEREREYQARWEKGGLGFLGSFADLLIDQAANDTAAAFIRGKIRVAVRDPAVAEALSPSSVVGCKRLCVDIGYYETFNRENVTLVDLRKAPIDEITAGGLRVGAKEYPLDALVFATGFDAMTGALLRIEIRGNGGLALKDKWAAGPRTYLGVAIAGFPNLFTITGPGSPSVLSNMLPSIEQHVEWIADAIGHLRRRGLGWIEATEEAEEGWVAHVNAVANATLFPSCNSWYIGANVPGKPRVFMPYIGFPAYVQRCDAVAANGYEGFALDR